MGFTLTALERDHKVVFVVHRLDIKYQRPARLYDMLEVTLGSAGLGRSRLELEQEVFRGEERLASARVTLACLEPVTWRPVRIPAAVAVRIDL